MTKRRGNGEGSIYRRADGRWTAALAYTDEDGRRQRRQFYGRTRGEVRTALDDARRRLTAGEPVKDSSLTVAAFVEQWISSALAASDRKATTRENYATIARTHLVPARFGAITLARLRPSDVERLLLDKADKATSTRRTIYTVLRALLDTAVRDELVRRNAAAAVRRPSVGHSDAAYLNRDQAAALLDVAAGDRLFPLLVFLLGTGARRGEALALHWTDVDLDAATARICWTLARTRDGLAVSEPKTEKSRRTVPLPRQVVSELCAHKARQAAERLSLGSAWRDRDLVFGNELGDYWEPRNVARRFDRLAAEAGLSGVSLHTLRHSTATALLEAGTSMRVVQELLGHASYAITADVYSHVGAGQQREAADRLERAFEW